MHIITNRFGEPMVAYDSSAEMDAAIRDYLSGDLTRLTTRQIKEFRDAQDDPNGTQREAAHAGRFSDDVDPLDFNGLVFIYDLGKNYADGYRKLLQMVGPHPITPLTLWELERELNRQLSTPTPTPKPQHHA